MANVKKGHSTGVQPTSKVKIKPRSKLRKEVQVIFDDIVDLIGHRLRYEDAYAVEALAIAILDLRDSRAVLDSEGDEIEEQRTVSGNHSYTVKKIHPARKRYDMAQSHVKNYTEHLGMTPKSRRDTSKADGSSQTEEMMKDLPTL